MHRLLELVAAFTVVSAQSVRNLILAPKDWSESLSPRIYQGEKAEPHSIPYQVLLLPYYNQSAFQRCGGALISGDYVLTAASCLRSLKTDREGYINAKVVNVVLGAHNIRVSEPTQQHIRSTEFTLHEKFKGNTSDFYGMGNNIALIKLPKTVIFDENIKPVALPKKSDASNTYEGKVGRASGWGFARDRKGAKISPIIVDSLQVMTASVISNEDCYNKALKWNSFEISPTNICTFAKTPDMGETCKGDIGGPLTVDGTLVGIVSFQRGSCQKMKYSRYTRVTSYLDWIQSNTGMAIQ